MNKEEKLAIKLSDCASKTEARRQEKNKLLAEHEQIKASIQDLEQQIHEQKALLVEHRALLNLRSDMDKRSSSIKMPWCK